MAKLNDERMQAAFQPYLHEGEELRHWAFGVKQPNIFLLMKVKTSTGGLFTHIRIDEATRPFVAKFHRAFSKNNRSHAMAISEAIAPVG